MQHMVSNEVDLEGYFRIFNGFFIVSFRSGLSSMDSMLKSSIENARIIAASAKRELQ